jgi:nitroreductase/dihydropteridine reductase
MSLTHALRWRYATKKFDSQRIVPEAIVDALLESANLTATSYGLQPYRFLVIRDQKLQERLVTSSYGQRQVADASHVIVIATRTDVDEAYIRGYVEMVENQRDLDSGRLEQYGNVMVGAIGGMSDDYRQEWAARQAYIALGTMLATCGALEIDSCPMEGFVPSEYDELLNLNEKNLHAAVVLPIGYRAEDDATQHQTKVRQPLEEMVIRVEG